MKARFLILLFTLLVSCSPPLSSQERMEQNIRFTHLTMEDGLSISVVNCTLQDHLGFIWIGTEEGLDRYDGYTVKSYRMSIEDPDSLTDNHVTALAEDGKNILWVGTKNGGLNYFDRGAGVFRHVPLAATDGRALNSVEVNQLLVDSRGRLWIATIDGLFMKKPGAGEKPRHCELAEQREKPGMNEDILCVYEDDAGLIWSGTRYSGLMTFDPATGTLVTGLAGHPRGRQLQEASIMAVAQDDQGQFWISLRDTGVLRLPTLEDEGYFYVQSPDRTDNAIPGRRTNIFFLDSRGTLWLGTLTAGAVRYNAETDSFSSYLHNPFDPYSLSDDSVYHIAEDSSGMVWLCTERNISLFNPIFQLFNHEYHIPGEEGSLGSGSVYAILRQSTGRLWVGHGNDGISYRDPGDKQFRHIRKEGGRIGTNYFRSMFEDSEGTLWFGSGYNGLYRLDPGEIEFTVYRHDPEDENTPLADFIRALTEDQRGVIWFGTQFGLNSFNKETGRFERFVHDPFSDTGLPGNNIFAILPEAENILWIGTSKGLARYNLETRSWRVYRHDPDNPASISNSTIYSLLLSSSGELWAGTSQGLNRFVEETQEFQRYTTADGLPNNVIYAIHEDENGNLWFSTNRGISTLDPADGDIITYNREDGLQGNEFNGNSSFKDAAGRLYFGGTNGFNSFIPAEIETNITVPQTTITAVRIFGQEPGSGADPSVMQELELNHDSNYISLDFAGMDATSSQKLKYQYKLEPFEREWVDNGTRRSVTYTNLPPGRYVFLARASDRNGNWHENSSQLKIFIRPAFWQTWWFKSALALAALALLAFLYYMRTSLLQKQKKELEQHVEENTKELVQKNQELKAFSASVSHDLRNPLWQIRQYAEIISNEIESGDMEKARHLVRRIENISEDASGLVEDLLQFSQFDETDFTYSRVDLSALALDVASQMREADTARNIRFDIEDGLQAQADERMIRILLNNLFSNSWKYTEREQFPLVEFGKEERKGETIFFVRDNGVGFDMSAAKDIFLPFNRFHGDGEFSGSGIGLSLVQRIVHRHGGRIWAESELGEGAVFYFTLPDRENGGN